MRFTLMCGLIGCDDHAALARAAEDAGWDSFSIPDSLFFPKQNESDYPYNETDVLRRVLEDTPVLEPFIAITQMAMATKKINFFPGVLKVPVRQPLVLAKTLSTLAVISGNRLMLGAGISPWTEDFIYNGVPFEPRGKMLDECIEIIRGVMAGGYFEYHGDHYDFAPLKMLPVPDKPVPVLFGGHSKPALRRAARTGDGWVSANSDFETLSAMITTLQEYRQHYGTENREDFQIHAYDSFAKSVDDYKRLQDLGVTDMVACPWSPYKSGLDIPGKIDAINRFAQEIITGFE